MVTQTTALVRFVFFNHDEFEFDQKTNPEALKSAGHYDGQVSHEKIVSLRCSQKLNYYFFMLIMNIGRL